MSELPQGVIWVCRDSLRFPNVVWLTRHEPTIAPDGTWNVTDMGESVPISVMEPVLCSHVFGVCPAPGQAMKLDATDWTHDANLKTGEFTRHARVLETKTLEACMIVRIHEFAGGFYWTVENESRRPNAPRCKAKGTRDFKSAEAAFNDFERIRKARHVEYRWPKEKP